MNASCVNDYIWSQNEVLIVQSFEVFLMNIQGKWKTYGELANFTFKTTGNLTLQCRATRLDFVADRYPALSIKKAERSRRAEKGVQRIHIFGKDQAVPKQWKNFMTSGENKESLLAFLIDHWRTYKTSQLESILLMTKLCVTIVLS